MKSKVFGGFGVGFEVEVEWLEYPFHAFSNVVLLNLPCFQSVYLGLFFHENPFLEQLIFVHSLFVDSKIVDLIRVVFVRPCNREILFYDHDHFRENDSLTWEKKRIWMFQKNGKTIAENEMFLIVLS